MPWLIIHSHHSFTLLFGFPQICHRELLQMDSWVPSTASPCYFFLKTFLLFAATRCSRIIWYFPCPTLHSNISPEILTLLLENGIRNQDLDARCAYGYWVSLLLGLLSQANKEMYIHIYKHTCIYVYFSPYRSVHILKITVLLPIPIQHYSRFIPHLQPISWVSAFSFLYFFYTNMQI